jgi:hypothetical protein
VENNGIWNYTFNHAAFSVSDMEGTNGLPFVSANDPRVPSINQGCCGTNGVTPLQQQQLYPLQASPTPLASGLEAQLIIAENQLATGQGGASLATLNALRTCCQPAPGGLPQLTLAPNHTAAVNQLFYERAFWLYLTSHRLGDMRRLIRQYNFNSESVFPVGLTDIGNPYGTSVNFQIPAQEEANPNFHGCLNIGA